MTQRVLCVDDEPMVLAGLRRQLGELFDLTLCEDPLQALALLDQPGATGEPGFAVVLADMRMPGLDGAEFLAEVRRRAPDTVRLMLTGNGDQATARRAVNEGRIARFLNKPCDAAVLADALREGLQQHALQRAERDLLENTLNGAIRVLGEILALVDPRWFANFVELKELAGRVARHMELERPWEVEVAAMLSRLGVVTVPPEVLAKAETHAPLRPREQRMLADVPAASARLIEHIPRLEGVAAIIDAAPPGEGEDDATPVGARILRVLRDMLELEEHGLDRAHALSSLAQGVVAYDAAVLRATCELFGLAPDRTAAAELMFDKLRPGHVLAAPLETVTGRLILREGQVIGRVLLERLSNLHELYGLRQPVLVRAPERHAGTDPRKRAQ